MVNLSGQKFLPPNDDFMSLKHCGSLLTIQRCKMHSNSPSCKIFHYPMASISCPLQHPQETQVLSQILYWYVNDVGVCTQYIF